MSGRVRVCVIVSVWSLIYILGCRDLYRCQSGNTNNNEQHKKKLKAEYEFMTLFEPGVLMRL